MISSQVDAVRDSDATLVRHNVAEDARSLIDDEVHRDCEYYVYSQLRDCIDAIDDDYERMKAENAKLREAVATAIKVQAVLCGDADSMYCRKKCPLHRQESDDCLACDVIGVAQELGIEVDA
jgi:hypothetical protein